MTDFFKSFLFAAKGIRTLFASERNFRIQVAIAFFVILLGLIFQLTLTEWALVVLAIGLVLVAEAINTAIEKLADIVRPEQHSGIGVVKDVAAAGSLLAAIAAAVTGLLVFLPHWGTK